MAEPHQQRRSQKSRMESRALRDRASVIRPDTTGIRPDKAPRLGQ